MPRKFSEVVPQGGDFGLPKLSELVNAEFEIEKVRFDEGKYGEYAVVTVKGQGEYRTSSEVLLKQLHRIHEFITKEKDTVLVKLVKQGQYYTFQ